MVRAIRTWLLAVGILIHGCARAEAPTPPMRAQASSPAALSKSDAKSTASLDSVAAAKASRRVIRNAEMTLEAKDQPLAEQKITDLAERMGGYTVSSERHQVSDGDDRESLLTIDVTVRVPGEKFQEFLSQARGIALRVQSETTSGQDVTEEFIDLEARIRTERALEAQYLEILKEAKSVKDALEVHQRLADVREQIEKAEGRSRFLENQTQLSTIKLSIRKFVPEIRIGGFGIASSFHRAAGDVVEVSIALLSGTIRVIGILLPIGVLLGIPAFYLIRFLRSRRRRRIDAE